MKTPKLEIRNPNPERSTLCYHPASSTQRLLVCFCFLLFALCFWAWGQYSIDWSTIDGGGGTSTGGVYSVSGTVGQHDAGNAMSGGNYTVTGGFWSLLAVVQTPAAPLLTITHSGNSVIVSWPASPGGFTLHQNGNLANAAGWSNYGGTVSTNNGVNSITLTAPVGTLFFRLSNP
jgi:hypothetical protein